MMKQASYAIAGMLVVLSLIFGSVRLLALAVMMDRGASNLPD